MNESQRWKCGEGGEGGGGGGSGREKKELVSDFVHQVVRLDK